jgi:DNA-binding CsgD family transcriptional regulator
MGASHTAEGWAALQVGDGQAARAAFTDELATCDSGEVWEGLSAASFVLLEYPRAIEEMETAYAAYRAAGDGAGAARVARMLGGMHGSTSGDWAVANGWIGRAKTLLADLPESSERGWVALTQGMFESERATKNVAFRRAAEVGRSTGDAELAVAALAYLGASLVHEDLVDEGMRMLDEALAAVLGGEVANFIVVEEIFCQMFAACEHAQDVRRAEQWIRAGTQVAQRRNLPAVEGYCRTHYGAILVAAGRWQEAERVLTQAVRVWADAGRTLRQTALVRLAALRVRQGRYDEGESLLEGTDLGEAVPVRAELHLARGEAQAACDLLDHAVQDADPSTSACIPLLALQVEAQVAAGLDPGEPLSALEACADAHPSPYASGLTALSRARTGQGDARSWLRHAVAAFSESDLPWETAVSRLELARLCAADRPEIAVAEARRAWTVFLELEAARWIDETNALLRRLGQRTGSPVPSGDPLTRREQEVLSLLGAGLSNPEIAERLFISRKTVEHHVGNILAKLGLRNRAEAAAHAVRREPATE